jgi:hypothetical protein
VVDDEAEEAEGSTVTVCGGREGTGEIPWAHTPFEQPWWLEAVAPGRWGEIRIERHGDVVARMPYVLRRRLGVRVLTHPPLTRYLGPWIAPIEGKLPHRLGVEKDLMATLIRKLPPCHAFTADFAPTVTNWLPFYWAGFRATTRYTYRIRGADPDRVWADCAKNVRGHVRRARKALVVRDDISLAALLDVHRGVFHRQGLPVPFDDDLARRIDRACAARDARTILAAVDAEDRVHAAAFTLHDAGTTYLLFGGPAPEFRSSGGDMLVIWEAIRRAVEGARDVDFLGSMIEPVERVNRGFGATQVPYLSVRREGRLVGAVRAARGVLGR